MNAAIIIFRKKHNFLVGANTIEYWMKFLFFLQFLSSNLIESNSKIANACFLQLKNSWLAHWAHVTARDGGVRQQDYKRGLAHLFCHVMAFYSSVLIA